MSEPRELTKEEFDKAWRACLEGQYAGYFQIDNHITVITQQLEAAKLREAEQASALEIARTGFLAMETIWRNQQMSTLAVAKAMLDAAKRVLVEINTPSAALAERDRAVEKRTAARCAEISDGRPHAAEDIRREFGLEPKHPVTTD